MASQQELAANVRRKTYLISRHGFALRVTKDGTVEASGCGTSDPFTILEMISVGPGEIVLRGESANRYIGMSPDGDLLTYNSLIEDCVFKEHHNMNGYSSFESRPYSGWFLALTNEGRAKPGPKTAPYQRAVEFLTGKVGQSIP
ncbi:fibroblast growth factor 2-like [Montipora capricornis]|uniref:fibroblast growth factor 2-like n=1 Tax=Montipora capricornis TaxID=246305 RepID=UPI0035F12845